MYVCKLIWLWLILTKYLTFYVYKSGLHIETFSRIFRFYLDQSEERQRGILRVLGLNIGHLHVFLIMRHSVCPLMIQLFAEISSSRLLTLSVGDGGISGNLRQTGKYDSGCSRHFTIFAYPVPVEWGISMVNIWPAGIYLYWAKMECLSIFSMICVLCQQVIAAESL